VSSRQKPAETTSEWESERNSFPSLSWPRRELVWELICSSECRLTFSCCSVSRRARWRHRAFCRCGGPGRPEFCSRKCQTGARVGARLTCCPSLRERVDGARKLPAESVAVPVPHP